MVPGCVQIMDANKASLLAPVFVFIPLPWHYKVQPTNIQVGGLDGQVLVLLIKKQAVCSFGAMALWPISFVTHCQVFFSRRGGPRVYRSRVQIQRQVVGGRGSLSHPQLPLKTLRNKNNFMVSKQTHTNTHAKIASQSVQN